MGKKKELLFDKTNYKFVIIGILFIIAGFILMYGGGSEDPNIFSEEILELSLKRFKSSIDLFSTFFI